MSDFNQYRRKQIAELRPVTVEDVNEYNNVGLISIWESSKTVSISDADRENGSPKIGDMIARNPKNHEDQWLVAEEYFKQNFEPIDLFYY